MRSKKTIECAVGKHFKLKPEEIYKAYKSNYPINGAKLVLIYMLYKEGVKSASIAKWFGFHPNMVYRYAAKVQAALKSDTKLREDVEKITEILNNKK